MVKEIKRYISSHRLQIIFLCLIYTLGLYFRLAPRLSKDPHLLTLAADIWERISIAQYFQDHGRLPQFCLRYIAYGQVPLWYPPISPLLFVFLSWIFHLDIPTVSSRIIPFIEALSPLSIFFLGAYLFNKKVGFLATIFLSLTPSFIFWSGISDPQSLTLFLLPVYIILLVWRGKQSNIVQKKRLFWIFSLGGLLAINFLTHLSYFLAVLILGLVALALAPEINSKKPFFVDLLAALLVSQLLTIWWWAPKNLYWWWIKSIVTSRAGIYSAVEHLNGYGLFIGILEICAALFLLAANIFFPAKKKTYIWLFSLWSLIPFLETQNELILSMINRYYLHWSSIFKPLEGFRFYCFLAQPLALIAAFVLSEYVFPLFGQRSRIIRILFVSVIIVILFIGVNVSFGWNNKIHSSAINLQEYKAAVWFRNNSKDTDRIVSDYYRAQLFAGICGGRALMGWVFPLRNVNFPYIKAPGVVQDDIYNLYNTKDALGAYELIKKYGCTHVFYSNNMFRYSFFGSKNKEGFKIDIETKKFKDPRFFEEVYNYNNDTVIIKIR